MYAGKVVEFGDRDAISDRPKHPYTAVLLSAVPITDPELQRARRIPARRSTRDCRFNASNLERFPVYSAPRARIRMR